VDSERPEDAPHVIPHRLAPDHEPGRDLVTSLSTSSIVPPSAAIVLLTGAVRAMPGF
jgi:hypothetical protein